ncbi:MAG: glycoside hydrolase family 3 C-terminal domain-containing protein [Spirochaetaceae bacterium]|nr:glycoside hydrolase family 3 C-terminal domain-containing protein [Spirochaetaceae bacterium]
MGKKESKKAFAARWLGIAGVVIVLALGVTIVSTGMFYGVITQYFGGQKYRTISAPESAALDTAYFRSAYQTPEEANLAGRALAVSIEEEGIVLLKNDGARALPLPEGARISVFGSASAGIVYGGSGSGTIDESRAATLESSLTKAGFQMNPALLRFYTEKKAVRGPQIGTGNPFMGGAAVYFEPYKHAAIQMDSPETSTYHIGEVPVADYTDAVKGSYAAYNDAALVVLGRPGGEGGDLSLDVAADMAHYSAEVRNLLTRLGIKAGQHQLELSQNEIDLLAHVQAQGFGKVIVIINSSEAMELGFLDEDWINAALWIGGPGEGLEALGRVLRGEVNPSGRLVDTYAYDLTSAPSFYNFGHYEYENAPGNYFVEYEEGIYVGYRYYETRFADDDAAYRRAVQYPFGYGLSYTTFDWEVTRASPAGGAALNEDGVISLEVRVTNTGSMAGKDVVQLYYTAPYTAGDIEKAHVVLGAFEKTGLLEPGASQTLTLTLPVREMASYDYNDANRNGFTGWELEAGTYQLRVSKNAHEAGNGVSAPVEYRVASGFRYETDEATGAEIQNRFDDVSGHIKTYLSRADWEGTWPAPPAGAGKIASDAIIKAVAAYVAAEHNNSADEAPVFNANNGVQLINLRDLPYDEPLWDLLLDQLNIDEFLELFRTGAYNTAPMPSVSKPATTDLDGPAGISSFIGNTAATGYPTECVIAATWSKDIARRMGEAIGEEGLNGGVNGWYAPAMNTHRSPFAGRNFEYYSEDGVLGGEIAAGVVAGATSRGMITYIKHFAMNDQETNRVRDNGLMTWANEQSMREIYFRPFEIAVKKGNPLGVMSSFNRIGTTWAGGSRALLTEILRNEWGFRGAVITDFNLYPYMDQDLAIRNGGDFMLTMRIPGFADKTLTDSTSATAKIAIRSAAHNILYATVNSNAMNGVAPGAVFKAITPTWVRLLIAADCVILALLVLLAFFKIKKYRRLFGVGAE